MTKKEWFLEHLPLKTSTNEKPTNFLLTKFIIEFFNELRRNHNFSKKEYVKLRPWQGYFIKKNTIKQSEFKKYCYNCKKEVRYNPLYLKILCNECASKVTDENRVELLFSNIGIGGGLRVTYKKNGKIIKSDTSQTEKVCYLNGISYIASEFRFGGIIIKKEE